MKLAPLTCAVVFACSLSVVAQEPRATVQSAPPIPETATEAQGLVGEPDAVQRFVIFADKQFGNGERIDGFYIDAFNMIPGAGWLSGGPGYRRWLKHDTMFYDASAAVSWHGYKTAQARFELSRLAKSRIVLGTAFRWQDYGRIDFFGEGPQSLSTNVTEYGLKSTNVVGYATLRPARWLDLGLTAGVLAPSLSNAADQPTFLHSEVSATADTRDFAGHPTRGGLYRAAMSRYSDRDAGVFSFKRYEAEAAHFVPVADSRVVLALHGWLAGSDDHDLVPFYMQPSIGGNNSLRGYADYRFHDRNLLLVNAEARIALMTHVDSAVFWDAGNVAPRFGDLNLDKRSWGVGLRIHSRRETYGRLDLAHSVEGWRWIVRLSDPLALMRLTRRTALVPFVP